MSDTEIVGQGVTSLLSSSVFEFHHILFTLTTLSFYLEVKTQIHPKLA